MVNSFQVGDTLVVQRTDHVMRRCPRKVGRVGVVQSVPLVPSGNYVLHDRETGDTIKLPASSLRLYEERDSRNEEEEEEEEEEEDQALNEGDAHKQNGREEMDVVTTAEEQRPARSSRRSSAGRHAHKNESPSFISEAAAESVEKEETEESNKAPTANKNEPEESEDSDAAQKQQPREQEQQREREQEQEQEVSEPVERAPVDLKVGMRVMIIGTANVWQRVPQLVDKIGVITEAPVHPATWFKVQFPFQEKIVTFRPTALQPVDDDNNPLEGFVVRNSGNKPNAAKLAGLLDSSSARVENSNRFSSAKKVARTLSALDPDTWVGRKVLIRAGKVTGIPATVLSVGSGWVTCETPEGTVARRAYELELVDGDEKGTHMGTGAEGEVENSKAAIQSPPRGRVDRSLRRERDSSPKKGRDRAGSISSLGNLSGGERERETTSRRRVRSEKMQLAAESKEVQVQARPVRGEREKEKADQEAENAAATAGTKRTRMRGERDSLKHDATKDNEKEQLSSSSQTRGSRTRERDSHVEREADVSPTRPMSQPGILNSHMALLRRRQVAYFLDERKAKMVKRPMLRDWEFRLNDLLGNTPQQEKQAARSFDDSHCEICCVEKLPSAIFCWNEGCPSSPVWFKLTGERPPHEREITAVPTDDTSDMTNKKPRHEDIVSTADCEDVTTIESSSTAPSLSASSSSSSSAPASSCPSSSPSIDLPIFQGVQSNVMTSYLLETPAMVINNKDNKTTTTRLLLDNDNNNNEVSLEQSERDGQFSEEKERKPQEAKATEGVFAGLVPLRPLSSVNDQQHAVPGPSLPQVMAFMPPTAAPLPALTFAPQGSLSALPMPRTVFKLPDNVHDLPEVSAVMTNPLLPRTMPGMDFHSSLHLPLPSKEALLTDSALVSKPKKKRQRVSAPAPATGFPLPVPNGSVGNGDAGF